jgi:hypothetical protein
VRLDHLDEAQKRAYTLARTLLVRIHTSSGPVEIERWLGANVLDPPFPVRAEEVEAQAVGLRIATVARARRSPVLYRDRGAALP